MNIRTDFIDTSLPIRTLDWVAWIDGDEEHSFAYGASEREAIENLCELIEVRK